jgi:hypothetical protein
MFLALPPSSWAAAGREGASFLDIPVGAEPASLGSAYTAVADTAYAVNWNPAGLGRLDVPQLAAMHLAYLQSISYEHFAVAVPLSHGEYGSGIGLSVQSLGSGSIDERDDTGALTGQSFTSNFSAYTLAYGQSFGDDLSFGTGLKVIREKISDASASAFALDAGTQYDVTKRWTLAAALSNLGSAIRLVDQSDPLPMNARIGTAIRATPDLRFSVDGVYHRNDPFSAGFGLEWSNASIFALRAGYNTAHTKELGAIAGITGGVALRWWGQEFSYAWVPFGDLGNTHYFSLLLRWSTEPRADRTYPDLPQQRLHSARAEDDDIRLDSESSRPTMRRSTTNDDDVERPAKGYRDNNRLPDQKPAAQDDYSVLYDSLNDNERRSLQKRSGGSQ